MMDSTSEVDVESDASSVDGVSTNEQLMRRIKSLQQENRVLKTEVDTLKLKIRGLNEMNQQLRQNSVNIQAKAEQEEEYISNTLLKKITELKKEKESLALNYEQEEECLTNELNRKFTQLRQEKVALEQTLAREQEDQVTKLKMRIEKLETDMNNKQSCLDKLRREKIELENALEQEQEALVNRLWKKMEKLENEKRTLQEKLESLGALLSASSSNQSLASFPQLSMSGNGSSQGGNTGLLSQPASQRPTSSGPGSLRSSIRQHHTHILHATSGMIAGLSGPNANSSQPMSLQSPIQSPGRPLQPPHSVTLTGAGDPRSTYHSQPAQLNQSASLAGDLLLVKTSDTTSIAPPQSPMDVDGAESISATGTSNTCPQNYKSTGSSHVVPTKSDVPSTVVSGNGTTNWDSHITAAYVNRLRDEVCHLRQLLAMHEEENANKMPMYESEERSAIEENRRLRKMLQIEKERREALSRQLSESESSLEMEDERQFNEACRNPRLRTTSESASPFHPPGTTVWPLSANPSAIYGPGHAYAVAVAASLGSQSSLGRCRECGQRLPSCHTDGWSTPPAGLLTAATTGRCLPTTLSTHVDQHHRIHGHSTSRSSGPGGGRCSCCSPSSSPGKTCAIHQIPLPNSPATPTTSSGGPPAFAKPANRISLSGMTDRTNSGSHSNDPSYLGKRLSSASYSSSNEQLLFGDMETHTSHHDSGMSGPPNHVENEEDEDDDDDARCATPPVCQPDSTK